MVARELLLRPPACCCLPSPLPPPLPPPPPLLMVLLLELPPPDRRPLLRSADSMSKLSSERLLCDVVGATAVGVAVVGVVDADVPLAARSPTTALTIVAASPGVVAATAPAATTPAGSDVDLVRRHCSPAVAAGSGVTACRDASAAPGASSCSSP